MKMYAYARVSTRDQNLERQIAAFTEFGVKAECIYSDRKSGKDFDRIQYKRLIKKLKAGDLLVVKSIDRQGRNYDAIIAEWSNITGNIRADILVLDMPLLDTRSKAETLVGKFISDIVLQVLSFVAENERNNIKSRQAEGIRAAIARGVRFGRPRAQYSDDFLQVAFDYMRKRIDWRAAVEKLGLRRDNFYYHIRKIKEMYSCLI